MDAIELDLDPDDPELVCAVAEVVDRLTSEHRDLTDPLTAIEADRRIGDDLPDATIEYGPPGLLTLPFWRVRRDGSN
jgi:hypothetical protein